MTIKNAWTLTKKTGVDFYTNNCLKLSASLAFFTIFSLPGLLIMIIWISSLFFGHAVVEDSLYKQLAGFVGHSAAMDLQNAMHSAAVTTSSKFSTGIGIVALVFGATSVFGEIQDSINHIWHLKAKPKKGYGLIKLVFNRLLSFSMIISLGFILLVSLVINGTMDFLMNHLMQHYPELTVVVVYVLNTVLTFIITAFIFAAIFKVLPDARVKWKHVRIGACVTAALFMLGRFFIGYILGHSRTTTAYGAAGSVVVVLLWVYYSSMILYFGAAFTHSYVIHRGSRIYPNSYSVWVQQIEVESDKSIKQQPDHKTVIETKKSL